MHTYTAIPEVYIIFLLRDLKTKKVRHQHPNKKKNGDAPGPLGDFVKSLDTERLFFPF